MYQTRKVFSTRALVDSAEEQDVLEELLEGSKPPLPEDAAHLHPLLATPFRYPPLEYGSRFGARHERALWYGSDRVETALAEVAYYRLRFFDHTEADLGGVEVELGAFRARVTASRGVDLTSPPFDGWRETLASPTSYRETQALGAAMRADGVEAFRFPSARDPQGGANIGALDPRALDPAVRPDPRIWYAWVSAEVVEYRAQPLVAAEHELVRFHRQDFEVDGALPEPTS